MAKTIMVDPGKLTAASTSISSQSDDYEKQYKLLFSEVDAMGAAWQGADNMAFVNQIKGFMEDFQQMTQLMRQYSEFLSMSAKTYTQAQNDTIAGAKKLTN